VFILASKNQNSTNSLYDKFIQEVNCIIEQAKNQQFSINNEVQNTLSEASDNINDFKGIDGLFSQAEQLQEAANLGISNLILNVEQYKKIMGQMEKECHQQQVATDMQVICAMQKAIAAMVKAQNSLMQSNTVDKIFDAITKCQNSIDQIVNSDSSEQNST